MVADILVVRVGLLVDFEDDGEHLPLENEVAVVEEGDVDGVLDVRRGVPGLLSAVERRTADSLRRGAVRLEREADVRADPRHVVRVEREVDGEPLVVEPGAKGRAEEVKGDQTRPLQS